MTGEVEVGEESGLMGWLRSVSAGLLLRPADSEGVPGLWGRSAGRGRGVGTGRAGLRLRVASNQRAPAVAPAAPHLNTHMLHTPGGEGERVGFRRGAALPSSAAAGAAASGAALPPGVRDALAAPAVLPSRYLTERVAELEAREGV